MAKPSTFNRKEKKVDPLDQQQKARELRVT